MIDYEKLKQAMDLANKINCYLNFEITHAHETQGTSRIIITFRESKSINHQYFNTLDEIIAALTKLTQPKPKYKVGDKVYMTVVCGDKLLIDRDVIREACFMVNNWEYTIESGSDDFFIAENELFVTKQELIETQIEYWQSLIDPDIQSNQSQVYVDGCQHEPDMNFANDSRPRYIKSNNPKCLKCGEFYR